MLEEKAHDAFLGLELNADVLAELRQYQRSVTESQDWPLAEEFYKEDLFRFEQRVTGIEKDLVMQETKLESFQKQSAGQKNLV